MTQFIGRNMKAKIMSGFWSAAAFKIEFLRLKIECGFAIAIVVLLFSETNFIDDSRRNRTQPISFTQQARRRLAFIGSDDQFSGAPANLTIFNLMCIAKIFSDRQVILFTTYTRVHYDYARKRRNRMHKMHIL